MIVVILDRIFDRHDVSIVFVVDEIHHRGERRRLSRTSWTSDEEEATRTTAKILHNRRQTNFCERQKLVRNQTQHHRDVAALTEDRGAETCRATERETEVSAANFRKFLLILLRRN